MGRIELQLAVQDTWWAGQNCGHHGNTCTKHENAKKKVDFWDRQM